MALSCNIFDIFDVREYNDLEIRVTGNWSLKVIESDTIRYSIACLWFPITILQ